MKDKKEAAGAGLAVIAIALAAGLAAKKVEAAPEKPIVGEDAKYVPVIRHPEIPPEQAYVELEVLPTSQEEQILSLATGLPIVSPVIDIEETSENAAFINVVEDTEEARLMALPNGGQCTETFLDDKGNYYACCNGYAILTIKAQDPDIQEKVTEIKTTGAVKEEPPTWMEKELLEQARTGYTQVKRNKMVNDYRLAHPGVSGTEAYKILFGTYLGR
ncbi:hypothetical protein ES705_14645 [subsurface metagenome]